MDIWTPLAVATGAVIKPLMDKLCDRAFWEKRYERLQRRKYGVLMTRIVALSKEPPIEGRDNHRGQ